MTVAQLTLLRSFPRAEASCSLALTLGNKQRRDGFRPPAFRLVRIMLTLGTGEVNTIVEVQAPTGQSRSYERLSSSIGFALAKKPSSAQTRLVYSENSA